jgi:diguanylate cyclase (GGDEF)-like protein
MLGRTTRRLRRQVRQLDHMATHDELTGLPNRLGFRRRIDEALARDVAGTLMLVDVDRFHEIDETLGSQQADELLVQVAGRLEHTFPGGRIARLGEDEFGVLVPGGDPFGAMRSVADAFADSFSAGGIALALDVRIGAAVHPDHGTDTETLQRHASIALSRAKEERLPTTLYAPTLERSDLARLTLAAELRDALRTGCLVVHYQPQAELSTGRVRGVEALVRWQHPERGLLPACEFIDVVERSGLMGELGRYVLEAGVTQWRAWADRGLRLDVAVNLSAVDLLDLTLPETIATLLETHEMPAERLVLEITERTLLHDEYQSRRVLERLNGIGVRLSIDDFGTGYSSLAMLRRLPIRQVKIDRSFVADIPDDRDDDQIVQSTIRLTHGLDAAVLAEGVETERQLHRLAVLGCDLVQGYLIGRPGPADDVAALMAAPPAARHALVAG